MDNLLLNGLIKISSCFTQYNYLDILMLFGLYYLVQKIFQNSYKIDIACACLSITMAFVLVVVLSIKHFDSLEFLRANMFQIFISCVCIVGYSVLIYLIIEFFLLWMNQESLVNNISKIENGWSRYFYIIGFCGIFIGWFPWILVNYPASFCPDANNQLGQFMGVFNWTAHHPPLSTFIMGILVKFGGYIRSYNFGAFLYVLIQSIIGAAVFSFCTEKLRTLGLCKRYCLCFVAFYALTPLWGSFAQWFEKDLLYTEIATLHLILMIEVIRTRTCKSSSAVFLFVTGMVASLLRNNGVYAIIPTLIVLSVWLKSVGKRRITLVLIGTMLFYGVITRILYPSMNIKSGSIKEVLSIPFQQTARYVYYYGNDVTDYEKEVIDSVLDYDNLPNIYKPRISDPVKGTYKGDDSKLLEYFRVWFKMFFKQPQVYIMATLNNCYGYLAPVETNIEAPIQSGVYPRHPYYNVIHELSMHHIWDGDMANIYNQIRIISMRAPMVKYFCEPGFYTWILIICSFSLFKKRCLKSLILFIPLFMNIIVCLASPLSNGIRYELPVIAAMPLILGWTLVSVNEKSEQEIQFIGTSENLSE